MRLRKNRKTILLVGLLALLGVTAWGKVSQPNSNAFGDSLAGWMKSYWAWVYTGEPASGQVGKVMFMPLPAGVEVPGSGDGSYEHPTTYVGHLDVTIKPGTKFVLPCVIWLGEVYADGHVDPTPPDEWFGNPDFIGAEVTVDGKLVITNANAADFYAPPTAYDPPIPYDAPTSYGSTGLAYYQGIGFVGGPLSVGTHTIRNYAWFRVPPTPNPWGASWGVIYDNTWTITVKP